MPVQKSLIKMNREELSRLFNGLPLPDTQGLIEKLNPHNEQSVHLETIAEIQRLSPDQQALTIPAVFYLIWATPKFQNQVLLVDCISECSDSLFVALLFHHVVTNFDNIPTDRKDKFFYILKKYHTCVTFDYILGIQSTDVLVYLFSLITRDFNGWCDDSFIQFVINCKSYLYKCIKHIKIDEKLVRKYLPTVSNAAKRAVLYALFE